MRFRFMWICAILKAIVVISEDVKVNHNSFCHLESIFGAVKSSDQRNPRETSGSHPCRNSEMSHSKQSTCVTAQSKSDTTQAAESMAVVLYDDSVISPFHKSERDFSFYDNQPFTVTIHQNWQQGGVAAVVWEAAVVLGEYLTKNTDSIKNKKVIELGAGTGLAGIVAVVLGADVLVTDREKALDTLNKNINLNKGVHKNIKINSDVLEWGKGLHNFSTYDIILGADVVYIEETFSVLLQTLKHLCHPKSVIFLSSKLRYSRDTQFFKMLETDFDINIALHDKHRDIYIYQARLKFADGSPDLTPATL